MFIKTWPDFDLEIFCFFFDLAEIILFFGQENLKLIP